MAQPHHFIRMKLHNLLYGQVPKPRIHRSKQPSAVCSAKGLPKEQNNLRQVLQHETNQETELITLRRARKYRRSHFSFSFVRNPSIAHRGIQQQGDRNRGATFADAEHGNHPWHVV